jgi:SAM-dependent methyltransferase
MTQWQTRLRRYIAPLGLLPAAFYIWRTLRSLTPSTIIRNRAARRRTSLPIPPDRLIFSATATRDVNWFLDSGAAFAEALRNALNDIERPINEFTRILDFGCGSGRVVRHWETLTGTDKHGCDYNARAVAWAAANLPFAHFRQNSLTPPLPYDAGEFDLCYSVSVFTHLPADLQRPWIEELHRVLAPGGILVLTLSGRGDFTRLTAAERALFEEGNLVVLDAKFAGTNMCAVYHPTEYLTREWSDLFTLRRHYPSGALGSPMQDLIVFERVTPT